MRPSTGLALPALALLLGGGVAHAGKFQTVTVNKANQNERAKDYFAIEVAKGERGCVHFTVHVKANPSDKQARSGFTRLEVFEGEKRVAWVPVERRDKADGGGHVITLELTPALAARTTLVLVQFTVEAGGNVYRVDLGSYLDGPGKEGPKKP